MELHLAAIFGFLLATLAVTSFGAPVERSIWNHSCGYAMKAESNTGNLGVRHGAAKQINVVGNQIAIAISHVNTKRKIINKFYNDVVHMEKKTYNYDWLPENGTAWYLKEACSLKRDTKVKKVFQKFKSSLQIFTATFEEMKKFGQDEEEKNKKDRSVIIDNIHAHLTQVLCEVEWSLMCLNATKPEGEAENFLSKKIWNESLKGTMLILQDWGVFLYLEEYLKEWKVIVNSLKKKNSCKWIEHTTKQKKPKRQKTKGKKHAS